MKRLITVTITNDKGNFDYYESEGGFWLAVKALWAIFRYGHGAINITALDKDTDNEV